jgi:glyoxylase-like metal-dependent hydrolase (beta-lactamase superfamily II)
VRTAAKQHVVAVVPGLYRLADVRSVNTYVWHPRPEQRAGAEPILFDCGWPWSGRALVSSLAALSCQPTEIKKIVITHADLDHAGRLASLQAVSGAEVIAHAVEAERLTHDTWRALPGNRGTVNLVAGVSGMLSARWPPHPVRATRRVQDGDEIGGGWIAVASPGHTPGHTSYFHPGLRTLIAGDALGSIRKGQIRAPQSMFTEDGEGAARSIRKLAALAPEVICFGHGPELFEAAQPLRRLAECLEVESGR